jgi:AraC-like DNA-binding protein
LFDALPTMLLVHHRDDYGAVEAIDRAGKRPTAVPRESGTWLRTTLKFSVSEARASRPGNAAMLARLTELMFVEIIREYMQRLPQDESGWLAGLKDPHVGQALRLLHARPMRHWTVNQLAREVAMSRSALAQCFTRLIGEPPMKYLSNWRMQLAKQLLRNGRENVQAVASRVGYESEPAFNRAFKRATGSPPAAWRRVALRRSGVDPDRLSIPAWPGSDAARTPTRPARRASGPQIPDTRDPVKFGAASRRKHPPGGARRSNHHEGRSD